MTTKSKLLRQRARTRKQSALLDSIAIGTTPSTISLVLPLSLHPDAALSNACITGKSPIAEAIRDEWHINYSVRSMAPADLERYSVVFTA